MQRTARDVRLTETDVLSILAQELGLSFLSNHFFLNFLLLELQLQFYRESIGLLTLGKKSVF